MHAMQKDRRARILRPAQIESFMEHGLCVVENAFSRQQALAAQGCVWDKIGLHPDKPSEWTVPYLHYKQRINEAPVLDCFTDRLAGAIEDLVGVGRWAGKRQWGYWPVNFHLDCGSPWRVPDDGWHVDGRWFHNHVHSHELGLLVLGLFSDVSPRGGATLVAKGSYKRAARILASHPGGLANEELQQLLILQDLGEIIEVTGQAGDVALIHPFTFHARSPNHSARPRFTSNAHAGLLSPMNLRRANPADYSVLEQSIVDALEGTRYQANCPEAS